jgi:hypothetical protein
MAKKKSEIEKVEGPKTSSIIDFIKFLTTQKKEWRALSPQDHKAFQPYIINRWLSMDLYYCEAINELQQYTMGMDKDVVWKLYYELLPATRVYINYIKAKDSLLFTQEELESIKKYFSISDREAIDYMECLKKISNGNLELERILLTFRTTKDKV